MTALMMYYNILIFLTCLQFAVCKTYDKVNLTYAYETRCPFCLQYVDQQLYAGYQKLSDYINFELIPIVSVLGDTGKLTCAHGENECFISKAQACAFERPEITEALKVDYLYCTEEQAIKGKDVADEDVKKCVNSILKDIVSYETVQTCMNGVEFVPSLRVYNIKADAYGVEFVPWLAFFEDYNELDYQHLRSNFESSVCEKLTNPPAVCNSIV